jgi:hypothetical protein
MKMSKTAQMAEWCVYIYGRGLPFVAHYPMASHGM